MKRLLLLFLLFVTPVYAQTYTWGYRTHATDCTSLTDGKATQLCYEQSTKNIYKCVPDSGDCSGSEWKLTASTGSGWTDDGTIVRETTITDEVSIGTTSNNQSKLQITGGTLDPATGASASINAYNASSCSGTAYTCSYYNDNQAGCTAHVVSAGGSGGYCAFAETCTQHNTHPTNCGNQSGCSFDYTTCAEQTTVSACNALTGSEGSCTANSSGVCSDYSNTDQATCETGHEGCTWNDPSCDGNYFTSCDGTLSNLCSDYNSTEANCSAHDPCSAVLDGDCSLLADEATCLSTTHCTANYTACSTWNGNSTDCTNNGCSYPGNLGDCTVNNDTDQGTCEANAGCTWSDPVCTGTYDDGTCNGGPSTAYESCSGSYYTGTCTGSYLPGSCGGSGGDCTGTAKACTVSPISSNSTNCNAQGGCAWSAAGAYLATSLQHRYKVYAYETGYAGLRYYAEVPSESSNLQDNGSGDGYDVTITWSAPVTWTPDGYRILKSNNGGSSYTQYKDDVASPYVDGGGFASGSTVTPNTYFSAFGSGPFYAPNIILENSPTTAAGGYTIWMNQAGQNSNVIASAYNGTYEGGIEFTYDSYAKYYAQNGHIFLDANGTEKARFAGGGNLGVGVSNPTQKLDVSGNIQASGYLKIGGITINPNNNETATWKSGSATTSAIQFLSSSSSNLGYFGGRTSDMFFSTANGNYVRFERSDTNGRNSAGIVAEALTLGADATGYGAKLYSAGSSNTHTIEGSLALGVATAPIAKLYIGAGSSSTNSAPIGIQTGGTLLSSPQAGMIETASDKIYYTIPTGTARKEFTLNDASLTSGRVPFATTNGRLTDDSDLTFSTDTLTATKIVASTNANIPIIFPPSNSTTAIKFNKADGTTNVVDIDTTNSRVGIGTTSPNSKLDVAGSIQVDSITNDTGLAAGTYTPTLTNVTNISASTAYEAQYIRVGNTVTVSGKVDIDITATGAYELGISLPVASNFGATEDCAGTAVGTTTTPSASDLLYIKADTANDRASANGDDNDTSNHTHYFMFTYQVI